jgi:acetoin utilization protein AcuB
MYIDEIMTAPVVTVHPEQPAKTAWDAMQRGQFRHMPVVRGGKLLGIVSDRDVQLAIARAQGDLERAESVGEIMWSSPILVTRETLVEEAARIMVEQKIGALPVMEGDELVGIVSESDVLRLIVDLLGVKQPSSRVEVELHNPASEIAEISRTTRELGTAILSIMSREAAAPGVRLLVLRVASDAPDALIRELRARGLRARSTRALVG